MSGFQSPITILQALENIRENRYLLPAFQREFVWSNEQIQELFNSLMKDYPVGSMLFWKVKGKTKTGFKFYKFLDSYRQMYKIHNDVTSTESSNDFHAILDGQQRLTALNIGLRGSYAYKTRRKKWQDTEHALPTRHLYLNLKNKDDYEFLFLKKDVTHENDIYEDTDKKWFKVGKILSLYSNEEEDIDDFCDDKNIQKEEKKILRKLEKVICSNFNINYYEEEDSKIDKVVNVFTRINSGGTVLSLSDILMSMCIANWKKVDARTEIHRLVDRVNDKGFDLNKDYVLKSFLYLYHNDIRFKIDNFKEDFIEKIENNWNDIQEAISSLFDLMLSFGLNRSTLTSYNATLPILYYLYHRRIYKEFTSSVQYQEDRLTIKKWLLSVILRRDFGSSADTILGQTRKVFTEKINEMKIESKISCFPASEISKNIRKGNIVEDDFIDELLKTKKENNFCFSILSLLYPNLNYKNNKFHMDHLHPLSKYEEIEEKDKENLGENIYNSILNLQMLDANQNQSKQDKNLKDWVKEQTQSQNKKSFLENHLIPDVDLDIQNFSQFIQERKKILIDKLKKLLN